MQTLWIGDEEITVEELIQRVLDDADWLEILLQDIQRDLDGRKELLAWLNTDQA